MPSLPEKLLAATERGDLETVNACLSLRADTEARDVCAFTPLIRAAYDNSLAIAEALLLHGADVHASCEESWTAAAYALQNAHFEMADLLARFGADLHGINIERLMGEDEVEIFREPMDRLISRAAGADVWRNWEAHCLARDARQAVGVAPRPRL